MDYVGPECLDESPTRTLPFVLVKILRATVRPRGDTVDRTFAASMPTLSESCAKSPTARTTFRSMGTGAVARRAIGRWPSSPKGVGHRWARQHQGTFCYCVSKVVVAPLHHP